MKGLAGIFVAVGLGVVGAVCNFFYVEKQARNYQSVGFVAIATAVNQGDRFQESHFSKVDVPKKYVGDLEKSAVKWQALRTVLGLAATKNYTIGSILLHQDLKTPPHRDLSDMLGENERIMWLPVDSRSFNPAQVNPGNLISFKVPAFTASGKTGGSNSGGISSSGGEIIGPFRILSLGNRRGRPEVQRASGRSKGSENNIAISVEIKNGRLEPKAERITQILQQTNFRGVIVLLHPTSEQ